MTPLLLLLFGASPASAETPPDAQAETDARARTLFDSGAALYEEGRYEDAIFAWEEAWRLSRRPLLLFNLANASERLGRLEEAMRLLTEFRDYADESEREILNSRIANIARRVDEAHSTPIVEPVTTPPEPPVVEAPVVEPAFVDPASGPPVMPGIVPPAPRARIRPLPIALFGVSGVALGGGIAFGQLALTARAEAGGSCAESGGRLWCTEGATAALDRDRTASLAADITFGIGVAALAGGVVTALLPPNLPFTVTPAVLAPGGGAVRVEGTFR